MENASAELRASVRRLAGARLLRAHEPFVQRLADGDFGLEGETLDLATRWLRDTGDKALLRHGFTPAEIRELRDLCALPDEITEGKLKEMEPGSRLTELDGRLVVERLEGGWRVELDGGGAQVARTPQRAIGYVRGLRNEL